MAALTSLFQLVVAKCPGSTDFLQEDALAKVYREFCLRSEYLQATETFTAISAGDEITLTPPANHYVLKTITVKSIDELGKKTAMRPQDVDYSQPSPDKLVISADRTKVEVVYSICPTALFDRTAANDEIINRWSDEIAAGAAAELRLMPGYPWSNPQLYDMYRRDFVRGWRDAKRARQEQFDDFQNYPRKRNFF